MSLSPIWSARASTIVRSAMRATTSGRPSLTCPSRACKSRSPDRRNVDGAGVRHVWSGSVADPPERPFTDNVAWDKESTHTRDRGSYLPIEVATELASEGVFAGIAAHFHGIPTEYSQRKTLTADAPQVLSRLRDDGADVAVLC